MRIATITAAVLLLTTLSAEPGFGWIWKSLSPEHEAKLEKEGDDAIASLTSSIEQNDLETVFLLEEFVLELPPLIEYEDEVQFAPLWLPHQLYLVLRYEFGIYYAGQRVVEYEEFIRTFNDKIFSPCQKLHSALGDWWKESYEYQYWVPTTDYQFEWRVAENICRNILESNTVEFTQQLYKRFQNFINGSLVRMCNYTEPRVAAKVDLVMRTVEPIDVARLNLLAKCIHQSVYDWDLLSLADPRDKQLVNENYVRALATFLRFEISHPQTSQDQASIEQLIEKELFEPCKSIHAHLFQITVEDDFDWARVEKICSNFAYLIETGESSQLVERVYTEYRRQLEYYQSDPELEAQKIELFISMFSFH